jgi:hypothetical protein
LTQEHENIQAEIAENLVPVFSFPGCLYETAGELTGLHDAVDPQYVPDSLRRF